MQIYIMRHGEASNQFIGSNTNDAARPLTELGEAEVNKMGQWLASQLDAEVDIFVSPYVRAQQTCNLVVNTIAKGTGSLAVIPKTLDFITPSGNAQQTHDFIDGIIAHKGNGNRSMLIISHMPFVSYLVAQLTQSQDTPLFATGAIAHINYDVQLMQGQLLKMYCPAHVHI